MNIQEDLILKIKEGKYPFSHIPIFKKNGISYLTQEFERCKDMFKERIKPSQNLTSQQLYIFVYQEWLKVSAELEKIEQVNKQKIEVLAKIAIQKIYDVPNHIILNIELKKFQETCKNTFDDSKNCLQINKKSNSQKLQDEINKRIILNAICHGSSVWNYTSSYYLIQDELNNINPSLIELYDKYTALTGISFWLNSIDSMVKSIESGRAMSQGKCKTINQTTIKIEGNTLPILLHELNKGVMDFLILHGLSLDFSNQELDYILQESDKYNYEIYYYLLAPTLWRDILIALQIETVELPAAIMSLSKKTYSEITSLLLDMNKLKEKLTS